MTQLSLLSYAPSADGQALKEAGVALVSANHPTLFQRLLTEAIRVSDACGEVHNDSLRQFAASEGLSVPSKLWGAIWARKGWRKIGERASAHAACHGHRSGVYVWEGR